MAVYLVNERGNRWSTGFATWFHLGMLAKEHGWEPAGTLPPLDWDGRGPWDSSDYGTNSGQAVTAEDAAALADALERALPHIPEEELGDEERLAIWERTLSSYSSEMGIPRDDLEKLLATPILGTFIMKYSFTPTEWLAGKRDFVRGFIAFLREGSFRIF